MLIVDVQKFDEAYQLVTVEWMERKARLHWFFFYETKEIRHRQEFLYDGIRWFYYPGGDEVGYRYSELQEAMREWHVRKRIDKVLEA